MINVIIITLHDSLSSMLEILTTLVSTDKSLTLTLMLAKAASEEEEDKNIIMKKIYLDMEKDYLNITERAHLNLKDMER